MPKWRRKTRKIISSYRKTNKQIKTYAEKYGLSYSKYKISYQDFKAMYEKEIADYKAGKSKSIKITAKDIIKKDLRPETLYIKYQKVLDKRVTWLMERGLAADQGLPKSFDEFVQKYNEYKGDLEKEVLQGKRKQVGDIVSMIVSDQVYTMSSKQYETQVAAIERWNLEHPDDTFDVGNLRTLSAQAKIRSGEYLNEIGWWEKAPEAIFDSKYKDFYKHYLELGYDEKKAARIATREARHEVRRIVYGSP